ncbi:MAG: hypothetical protein ACLP2Y_00285 [Limisphaerales bacterium]
MKTHFSFVMIGCAMLLRGVSHADPAGPASAPPLESAANTAGDHPRDVKHAPPVDGGKPPTDGKSPHGNQDGRRAAGNSNDGGSTSGTRQVSQPVLNRLEHLDKTQVNGHSANSLPANAAGVRQPVSIPSAGSAKAALARNKTDNIRGLTVRPPSVIQPAGLLLKEAHNRGPATAVIGGTANAKNSMTAAINGTGMNRKTH